MAFEHLLRGQADGAPEAIALPGGGPAPFGTIVVDRASKCTLCLSCVGACPGKRWSTIRIGLSALHREQLRAVRPVRTTCPRAIAHAAAAAADGAKARRKGARALRGRAVPLRALRQAVRPLRVIEPGAQVSRATRCSRAGRRRLHIERHALDWRKAAKRLVRLSLEQSAQDGVASPERKLTHFARQRPPVPGRSCVHRTTEHPFYLGNIIRLWQKLA